MTRWILPLLIASLWASPSVATDPTHPVVVELYQSQGCSSCPPAIANINAIAGRPDVLALTFAVTYWDRLGWKDTFAKPAFTARQWDYAHAAGRAEVATPQTIINGRVATNGGNRADLIRSIRAADRGSTGPEIETTGDRLIIGRGKAVKAATVWLVRYDGRTLSVPIGAGENGGKTLAHRNVVRSIEPLGSWTGVRIVFPVPAATDPVYRTAVLIQQGKGGPILAARGL